MKIFPTTLCLIRHAAVATNDCYLGQQDVDCIPPQTLHRLHASHLKYDTLPWYSSNLKRCLQTSDFISNSLGIAPRIISSPALREQHFGQWQGKRYEDIFATHPSLNWDDPASLSPPDGESFHDVCERVAVFMQEHVHQSSIIIAHAGSLRAILAYILGLTPAQALHYQLDYGSLSVIICPKEGKANIELFNQALIS